MPQLHPPTTVPSVSGCEANKEQLMAPECLVAIASAARLPPVGDEHRRDNTTPPELPSKRMYSVLDALASLCVSAGKGEAYAVGLQLLDTNRGSGGKIILTIAGNGAVPFKVLSHLRALWMQLQGVAKICCKHYKDQGMPYGITTDEVSPPSKNALNDASELLQRLKINAYRHCFRNFVACVDKRYNAFLKFSERVKDYWLQEPEIDKVAQDNFEAAVRLIKVVIKPMILEVVSEMVSKRVEDVDLDPLPMAVNTLQPQVHALMKSQRLHVWCKGVAESKSLR